MKENGQVRCVITSSFLCCFLLLLESMASVLLDEVAVVSKSFQNSSSIPHRKRKLLLQSSQSLLTSLVISRKYLHLFSCSRRYNLYQYLYQDELKPPRFPFVFSHRSSATVTSGIRISRPNSSQFLQPKLPPPQFLTSPVPPLQNPHNPTSWQLVDRCP